MLMQCQGNFAMFASYGLAAGPADRVAGKTSSIQEKENLLAVFERLLHGPMKLRGDKTSGSPCISVGAQVDHGNFGQRSFFNTLF